MLFDKYGRYIESVFWDNLSVEGITHQGTDRKAHIAQNARWSTDNYSPIRCRTWDDRYGQRSKKNTTRKSSKTTKSQRNNRNWRTAFLWFFLTFLVLPIKRACSHHCIHFFIIFSKSQLEWSNFCFYKIHLQMGCERSTTPTAQTRYPQQT